jgi:hypothetical protein
VYNGGEGGVGVGEAGGRRKERREKREKGGGREEYLKEQKSQ